MCEDHQDQDHHDLHHHHHHGHHGHQGHQGHHEHHADESTEFAEKNKQHWNKHASTYASQDWARDMLNLVHAEILANLSWIGVDFIDPSTSFENPELTTATKTSSPATEKKSVRVLDYACGPGTITNILAGHATEFVGIDFSENMVKAYNARFASETPENPTLTAHAIIGDLLHPSGPTLPSTPELSNFDLVAVGFGFHHFENLPLATARLVSRLKPGGVFMIVDFVTHSQYPFEKETAEVAATISHHGFGEDEVRKVFEGVGLVDVGILGIGDVELRMRGEAAGGGQRRTVFLGKGKKTV